MANDPESTVRLYDEVMERLGFPQGGNPDIGPERCVGLLSLRADRGDRTLQWADALAGGLLDRFDALPSEGRASTTPRTCWWARPWGARSESWCPPCTVAGGRAVSRSPRDPAGCPCASRGASSADAAPSRAVPNPDARNDPNAPATIKSPVVNNWQLTRDLSTLVEQKAMELRQAADGEEEPEYLRFLTRYTDTWARGTMQKWWELGNFFWAYYARGW